MTLFLYSILCCCCVRMSKHSVTAARKERIYRAEQSEHKRLIGADTERFLLQRR